MAKRLSESKSRSAAKSLSFRGVIIVTDILIMFTITRRYDQTFWLVLVSNVASTLIYFLHERVWNLVRWGRRAR